MNELTEQEVIKQIVQGVGIALSSNDITQRVAGFEMVRAALNHYVTAIVVGHARAQYHDGDRCEWQWTNDGQGHKCCLPFGHQRSGRQQKLNCVCGGCGIEHTRRDGLERRQICTAECECGATTGDYHIGECRHEAVDEAPL